VSVEVTSRSKLLTMPVSSHMTNIVILHCVSMNAHYANLC